MAAIRNFEDLESWKTGKELYIRILKLTRNSPISKEYQLRDQLLRSGLSVSNNIAEGFERGGDKEFRRFLIISNGSAAEIKSMLLVISEVYTDIDSSLIKELINFAQKSINLNKGMIKYLNSKIE